MASGTLRKHIHHIDKRLRFRLRLYFFISLLLIAILVFNIGRGSLQLGYGIAALCIGIGIGIMTSRMFHISWDKDAQKVASRLDLYGIIILICYILLEVFREKIISYITHDFQVGTIGFAVLAGSIFGRFLGTRGKIIRILKEQQIFS